MILRYEQFPKIYRYERCFISTIFFLCKRCVMFESRYIGLSLNHEWYRCSVLKFENWSRIQLWWSAGEQVFHRTRESSMESCERTFYLLFYYTLSFMRIVIFFYYYLFAPTFLLSFAYVRPRSPELICSVTIPYVRCRNILF